MTAGEITANGELRPSITMARQARVLEGLYLTLLPVTAVFVLGMSLVDQQHYVDPEFYTGYGQSFPKMYEMFGLTYYAARFPIIVVNRGSQWLLPGLGGYALVRFAVFLMCAVPLYVLARRHYGRPVAMASYAFLVLNPLLPRILCWDLTTFLSIPAGFAGITLWYLSPRTWSAAVLAAGFLFGLSINSHIFTGTAIGIFLCVELAFAARRPKGLPWFGARVATLAAGGFLCLLFGLAFYASTVGPVSPQQLWRITMEAVSSGHEYALTHYVPLSDYYARNYEIYVPLLTTGAAILLNGRRLLTDTLDARITWFAASYLAAYVIAVFALRMNIVQYFWYFGHLTIVVYLAVPVILAHLAERAGARVAAWFAGTLAVVALAATISVDAMHDVIVAASKNGAVAAAIALAAVCCLALLRTRRPRQLVSASVLLAVLVQAPFLSATHFSVYDVHENAGEPPLFDAIVRYRALLDKYDKTGERVRTWYRSPDRSMLSLASSNLLFTLQPPWTGNGLPLLGEAEKTHLADAATRYVLLVDPRRGRVEQGLAALRAAGIRFTPIERHTWGWDPVTMHAVLVRVER